MSQAGAVTQPESLGGVVHDYSKWVRYGMIFGGLYWYTEGGVLTWALYGTVFFLGMLYFQQNTLLYAANHPQIPRRPNDIPAQFKMSSPAQHDLRFEDVYIKCPDGEIIHSWLILQATDEAAKNAPTVMYFHGNAGNIGMRLPMYKDLVELCKCNVMAVEYRGYGNSGGIPSEKGLRMDAESALKYLRKSTLIDPSKIFLFGRSLGGAVAAYLAAKYPGDDLFCGLILENTFVSIGELALKLFPLLKIFQFLLPLMLKNKWDSKVEMAKVRCPVLFLSGLKDKMIPSAHMQALYDAATDAPKRIFKVFPNGGHNDTPIVHKNEYNNALVSFLRGGPVSKNTDGVTEME
jgi:pimeloyl-ACP methyl ester carboxylesterase